MDFETLLVHWEWKGFFLLLLAAGLYWCIRRRSAQQRYVLLLSALSGLLMIPLVDRWASWTSSNRLQLLEPSGWQSVGFVLEGGFERLGVRVRSKAFDPARDQPFGPDSSKIEPRSESEAVSADSVERTVSWRWDVAWLVGFCFLVARSGWQYFKLSSLVRSASLVSCPRAESILKQTAVSIGMRSIPRLVESDRLKVPATWGWFRSYIGLPLGATDWQAETLKTVLEHECMHIKRNDYAAQQFAGMVHALAWCNPMSWWAIRRLRQDMELACDEQVIASGTSPSRYAQTLLDVAQSAAGYSPSSAAVLMASTPHVQRRIEAVLSDDKGVGRPRPLWGWAAAIGVLSVAVFIGWQATMPTVAMSSTESTGGLDSETDRRLKQYFQTRFERSRRFIDEKALGYPEDSDLFGFYQLGRNGEWQEALSLANEMEEASREILVSESAASNKTEYELLHETVLFQLFTECRQALEACLTWSAKDIAHLLRNTIHALPDENGILIWDERAGGALLSLYSETGSNPMKIALIDLNSLTDNQYVEYLRTRLGDGIRVPSNSELHSAYVAYMNEAMERHRSGQLRDGETVSVLGDGHFSFQGQTAVMGVAQQVVEWIVDKNENVPVYFAGSSFIRRAEKKLQPLGYLTALSARGNGAAQMVASERLHSEWRALFRETRGVAATRESVYKLLQENSRDVGRSDGMRGADLVSAQAWASLRVSQALAFLPPDGSTTGLQDLSGEAIRTIDEAFLQAWMWDPTSESIEGEYLSFLEMAGEVEWLGKFSSLLL